MKKYFLFLLSLTLIVPLLAQDKADDIIGYYYLTDPFSGAISQAKIYKASNGTYEGIVEWAKDPDRKKFEGLVFLKDLKYSKEKKEWQGGKIQYPGKNGVYDTYMSFEPDGRLRVRGYWKMSLLGKTIFWTKESRSRKAVTL